MMKKEIYTDNAPAAIGPYSQAIQAGDFLYVSGQIGINQETGDDAEGIEAQTKQVMEHLKAILAEANTSFADVIKFTIYIQSIDNFDTVNDIDGGYLQKPYPARAAVEVSRLPKDVVVEIDAVVYTGK